MNRLLFIPIFMILFSCGDKEHLEMLKASVADNGQMILGFRLDYDKPLNFEKNLKMFSSSDLHIRMRIYDMSGQLLAKEDLRRSLKYDRWNGQFTIKDSFSNNDRTFSEFQTIEQNIYEFSNVPMFLKKNYGQRKFLLIYDFYFKTVDFAQPFKFIEFYIKTDNIQNKNNKIYFYAENN